MGGPKSNGGGLKVKLWCSVGGGGGARCQFFKRRGAVPSYD